MALYVRGVTEVERTQLEQIVRAETAPVRLVERARIILRSVAGLSVPVIAAQIAVSEKAARHWIKRFNAAGLAGLDDAPRAGRPPIDTGDEQSRVIANARSRPPQPEGMAVPPTCHWTLDRLTEELNKEGVPIKRSQIRRSLRAEHIKWQRPRTWLESDDPQVAEKRGPSPALHRSSCGQHGDLPG
jgi:transposase